MHSVILRIKQKIIIIENNNRVQLVRFIICHNNTIK